MINLGELERAAFGGEVEVLFARCVTRLKNDAREIEVLREEIGAVITRTAKYLTHPLSARKETVKPSELK